MSKNKKSKPEFTGKIGKKKIVGELKLSNEMAIKVADAQVAAYQEIINFIAERMAGIKLVSMVRRGIAPILDGKHKIEIMDTKYHGYRKPRKR